MLSVSSTGAGATAASLPPAALDADRSSALRTVAGAAARGLAELAIETVAPQVAKTAKAKTSTSTAAKRSTTSKSSSAGYAKKTSTTSKTTSSKSADPLAFLSDPKLSIEDKLMRLLAHLNEQYEAQMQQHMDVLAGKTSSANASSGASSGSSGTTKKKKGGLFRTLASFVSKVFPGAGAIVDVLKDKTFQAALKKLGGPVLAAAASALGFPALAPALLKLGPELASGAVDLAKALDAEVKSSRASTSGSAGSSGSSPGKTGLSTSQQQLEFMEIQRLYERQKEMFTTVSNILKVNHDMRSGIIANIR